MEILLHVMLEHHQHAHEFFSKNILGLVMEHLLSGQGFLVAITLLVALVGWVLVAVAVLVQVLLLFRLLVLFWLRVGNCLSSNEYRGCLV